MLFWRDACNTVVCQLVPYRTLGPLFEGRVTRRRQVTSVVKSLIFKYNSPVAHVPVPARALARA